MRLLRALEPRRHAVNAALDVLFVDNHLLVVAKPAGLATAPDESGDLDLLALAKQWVKREFAKPGEAFVGLVHRLDRPVSGVVAFARTSKAASRLSEQFRAHTAGKTYLGIGIGRVASDAGVLEQSLQKDEARNVVSVVAAGTRGARIATTRWRVLARAGDRVLFEFEPATGRPHQLRVAAATLGAPLAGDLKYGARVPLADASVALHALRLALDHPTRGERLVFEAPLPPLEVWDLAR